MGTYEVQMIGALPWLVRWARRAGRRDFYPTFGALISAEQNIFFSPHTFSLYMSPSPSNLGKQVVPGRLSLNMCLTNSYYHLRFIWRLLERDSNVFQFEAFPNGASDLL
jgi:hypothetical protein